MSEAGPWKVPNRDEARRITSSSSTLLLMSRHRGIQTMGDGRFGTVA